jgi:hypothetical protein
VRDRILPVLPKPLLAVLLGLSLSLNLALFFYVLYLSDRRKLKPRFGVLWDRELTAYCPAHKEVALGAQYHNGTEGLSGLVCANGLHVVPLTDDRGKPLKLEEAKGSLRSGAKAIDDYQPDEIGTRILVLLAQTTDGATQDHLRVVLRIHNERVRLYLSELVEHGYIYSIWAGIADAPITYFLYEKASRFLVDRGLIYD